MKGPLRDALIKRGTLDATHPAVEDYIEAVRLRKERYEAGMKRPVRKKPLAPRKEPPAPSAPRAGSSAPRAGSSAPHPTPTPRVESLPPRIEDPAEVEDVRSIAQMTLADVVAKFGTASRLKEYVSAVRIIEQTRKTQLENGYKEGQYVSRSLVDILIGVYDGVHTKILTDATKAISVRVSKNILAGDTPEQAEVLIREILSKQLRAAKAQITRALAGGKVYEES